MKITIQLSEEEIRLSEVNGLFEYRINDRIVVGIKTREEALKHAQSTLANEIKLKYKRCLK